MTREHKLALIIGFSLVLVVGVLISDHFSKAHEARVKTELADAPARNLTWDGLRPVGAPPTNTGGVGGINFGPASASGATQLASNPPSVLPAVHDPVAAATNGGGGRDGGGGITMGNRYSAAPQSDRIAVDLGRGSDLGSSGTLMSESTRTIDPEGALTQPLPTPSNTPTMNTGGSGGTGEVRPVMPHGQTPGSMVPGGTTTMGGNTPPTVTPVAPKEDMINGVPVRLCSRYDVKEGDSMYRIAKEKYGDASLWNKLAEFNKGKVNDKGSMRHGVTILCPPKEALLGKPLPTTMTDSSAAPSGKTTAPQMVDPALGKPKTDRASDKKDSSKNTEKAVASGNGPRSYTVVKGDVLSDVARKTLGSSKRWMEIHDLNKDVLDDEDSLVVGMTLKIPAR